MNCKRWMALTAATLLWVGMLCGCQGTTKEQPPSAQSAPAPGEAPETVSTVTGVNTNEQFSDRDQTTEYDASEAMSITLKDGSTVGNGVSVKGNTITVVNEGTYVFSGSLSNGRLVVDAAEDAKVHLIFNGVSVTCPGYGALYVKQADKVVITLGEGAENVFTSTEVSTTGVEENVDGALFSKDDLTVNGSGSLTVKSPGHGIVCKADLAVVDGNVNVSAEGHALQAKKSARIGGGFFTLTAGKDGIHVENPDDAAEGYLYIEDGAFTVTAAGDGFSAATLLQVSGGKGTLICGGGVAAAPAQGGGGYPGWGYSSSSADTDDTSSKGMKGGTSLLLSGGTWELDTADDGLHTNGDLTMAGGTLTVATGDDGVHADGVTVIKDGVLNVTESYEGIEGNAIEILGGTISVTASDDGLNAAGGNDQSGYGGGRPDQFSGDSSCYIRISGGKTVINAAGDGVDANYSLYVEGGETYVSGPTNGGNGALDYGQSAQVTGGIFVAVGAQGMAQGFTSATNQGAMLLSAGGSSTGEIRLADSDGNLLLRWTPEKSYGSIVLSCPGLVKGETYTLSVGGTEQTIEMTDWILGSSGGTGGGDHGGPGGGGGRPGGGMQRPNW